MKKRKKISKKNTHKNLNPICIVIVYLLLVIITLLLDYFDFFNLFSLRLNAAFLDIFITNITVIFLFCISYLLIDKKITDRENKKNDNKKESCYLLLRETYKRCTQGIYTLKTNLEFRSKFEKTFGEKYNPKYEELRENLYNIVFVFDDKIFDFISDGVLTEDIIQDYISLKSSFNEYLISKISIYVIGAQEDKESIKNINEMENSIISIINASIDKLL